METQRLLGMLIKIGSKYMTNKQFNKLEHREKLLFVHYKSHKIDKIFPSTGALRIITLYKLYDFIVEIECNLTKENTDITYVVAHNSYDLLLEKYPYHFDKFKREVINNLVTSNI